MVVMRKYLTFISFSLIIFSSFSQKRTVRLLFGGDAMQHLPQVEAAKTGDEFNYDSCFILVKDRISQADIASVNFETTLGNKPYTGYPMFSSPDEFAVSLKNAGFNLFAQANNHALDRGRYGLERTIDILDSIGIKHTGTFKTAETRELYYPLMVIKNGIRIAFLNYSYDTNGLRIETPNQINLIDTIEIKRDIHRAHMYNPDIIIAIMHWGEEYQTYPTHNQRRLTKFLQNNGVRIIIGHHPHVIQPISITNKEDKIDKVVYYSLGNFISNQQKINTDGGMIAEIVISKTEDKVKTEIESCDYWLLWVWKNSRAKNNYMLIPTDLALASENKIGTNNNEIGNENGNESDYKLNGDKYSRNINLTPENDFPIKDNIYERNIENNSNNLYKTLVELNISSDDLQSMNLFRVNAEKIINRKVP